VLTYQSQNWIDQSHCGHLQNHQSPVFAGSHTVESARGGSSKPNGENNSGKSAMNCDSSLFVISSLRENELSVFLPYDIVIINMMQPGQRRTPIGEEIPPALQKYQNIPIFNKSVLGVD